MCYEICQKEGRWTLEKGSMGTPSYCKILLTSIKNKTCMKLTNHIRLPYNSNNSTFPYFSYSTFYKSLIINHLFLFYLILLKIEINIYQRFLDAVNNIIYPLSFIYLLALVSLKRELIKKMLSVIRVFIKSQSY